MGRLSSLNIVFTSKGVYIKGYFHLRGLFLERLRFIGRLFDFFMKHRVLSLLQFISQFNVLFNIIIDEKQWFVCDQ